MKIIISPTKTMKRKNLCDLKTKILFKDKSNKLRDLMKNKTHNELKKSLKISDNLTERVIEYYQEEGSPIAAINLYEGAAFKAMSCDKWNQNDFEFAKKNIYILSAMYGALRPTDEILEYRLDYLNGLDMNLYEFWEESLEELFREEGLIVNLASQEFSKSITHPNVLNIHFLDEKERNLSTQAKQGRGDMIDYIVTNKIQDPEKLKSYSRLNYNYDKNKSDEMNYYFCK